MKPIYTIISAAAAAIAAMIRLSVGNDGMNWIDPEDAASDIPPMTPKYVEKLAFAGGTDQEIADRFRTDVSVIQRDYANVVKVARALRSIALRSSQFELARKSNGPMLIWLGKNELGQSNSPLAPEEQLPEITDDGS